MNKVQSYAGSTNPEQPRSLEWEGKHYQVQEIINRAREPECMRFLVRCSPENRLFQLEYDLIDGKWLIQPKGSSKHSPNNTGE